MIILTLVVRWNTKMKLVFIRVTVHDVLLTLSGAILVFLEFEKFVAFQSEVFVTAANRYSTLKYP